MQTVHPLLNSDPLGLSSQDKGGQHSHQCLHWYAVFSKNSPDTLWFIVGRQYVLNASASSTKLCSDCRWCLPVKLHLCRAVADQRNELRHTCTELGRPLLHSLQVLFLWVHPALFSLWTPNPKRCPPRLKITINTLYKNKYVREIANCHVNCRIKGLRKHTAAYATGTVMKTWWQVWWTMRAYISKNNKYQ